MILVKALKLVEDVRLVENRISECDVHKARVISVERVGFLRMIQEAVCNVHHASVLLLGHRSSSIGEIGVRSSVVLDAMRYVSLRSREYQQAQRHATQPDQETCKHG